MKCWYKKKTEFPLLGTVRTYKYADVSLRVTFEKCLITRV